MVTELKLAPTPEAFLRELVSKPGEFVIPGYDYSERIHDWAATVWFDTEPALRNGTDSFVFRINAVGLEALLNDMTQVAYRLRLELKEVHEIANFLHLKNQEH